MAINFRFPPVIFQNPWLAFLGTLSGIIGLPLSIYFGAIALKSPDLTYVVNPTRTSVLQAGVAAGLRVLHNAEEIIGDVTAIQIAVWNNGDEPITTEKILRPIRIVTRPAVRILEATIRNQSREEIEFALDTTSLKAGLVPVSWRILEKSDGASVQLIYAGPIDTEIRLEGTVIGQRTIAPGSHPATTKRKMNREATVSILFGLVGSWLGLLILLGLIYQGYKNKEFTWYIITPLTFFALAIGSVAVWGTYTWHTSVMPPFGF